MIKYTIYSFGVIPPVIGIGIQPTPMLSLAELDQLIRELSEARNDLANLIQVKMSEREAAS